ncbi:hypothetical protein FOVG_19994 [Fusarium oxysporum f. sp. pisi HDV247]|uniref:Uncharacterized protein n=1 Tax=Fusarium oxysporum f. sp. pisi HDV247 TaxID=1080344 RepID=W9NCH4_FUSOX|nr:hypothetical protein FOVG_19994 [Fusarium oxysporum f. sp. pisi HDV247]
MWNASKVKRVQNTSGGRQWITYPKIKTPPASFHISPSSAWCRPHITLTAM